jgi:hypothetical protein
MQKRQQMQQHNQKLPATHWTQYIAKHELPSW